MRRLGTLFLLIAIKHPDTKASDGEIFRRLQLLRQRGCLRRLTACSHLLLTQHIEHAWVIMLVHGLCLLTSDSPRTMTVRRIRTKRMQQPGHVPPTNVQAFEHDTAAQVAPQVQNQRNFSRVPRHLCTRPDTIRQLDALASMVILQQKLPVQQHLLHASGKNQLTTSGDDVAAFLLLIYLKSLDRRSVHVPSRTSNRIYSIVHAIPTSEFVARHKSHQILRKRNHVPAKLPKPSRGTGHKVNLHVLQRHEHSFDHGSAIEQLL